MSAIEVTTVTRIEFDRDVAERVDEQGGEPDLAGWYCVRTQPFPCPAEGCDFVAYYMTAAHRVVVWPEKDDVNLLRFARDAQKFGRDPRVVEWEPAFGAAISYYLWQRIGRPIHGRLERPEGYREGDPGFRPGGRE